MCVKSITYPYRLEYKHVCYIQSVEYYVCDFVFILLILLFAFFHSHDSNSNNSNTNSLSNCSKTIHYTAPFCFANPYTCDIPIQQ